MWLILVQCSESHTCIKADGLSKGLTLILLDVLLIMVVNQCVLLIGVCANQSEVYVDKKNLHMRGSISK